MPKNNNSWELVAEWMKKGCFSRSGIIREFNKNACDSFEQGSVPYLLEAKKVKGDPRYQHLGSITGASGIRITIHADTELEKDEIISIGLVLLTDEALMKRLVILGFDTLQIHQLDRNRGCQWPLHGE